jgi:DNA-binding transcriptional regulator of glucitol operon
MLNYLLALLVLIMLQSCFTFLQYRSVRKKYDSIRARFPVVAVGRTRGIFVRQAVLAFDKDGVVQESYMLAGFTVFSRLQRIYAFDGQHYSQVKTLCANRKNMGCILQAIGFLEEKYKHYEEVLL